MEVVSLPEQCIDVGEDHLLQDLAESILGGVSAKAMVPLDQMQPQNPAVTWLLDFVGNHILFCIAATHGKNSIIEWRYLHQNINQEYSSFRI